MGAALGLIGPLASIGGALFGGGSTANNVPQAPPVYQPTGSANADQNIQSGISGLSSSTVPRAQQTADFLYNNPGAAGAQAGAQTAGQLGQAAGLSQFTQGQNLIGTGNSVVPYAYSALNAGFDPQSAMYNQAFQQNTDQTRALLEARGIDSTPYGAGVEADSNRKFNTDWQFNQLARQQQGAQTANSLFGTQTGDVTAGANLSGQAPGTYFTGASLPYNTNQTIGTNQFGALGQSQSLQQAPISDYFQYLQAAQAAAGVGTQQQQTNLNQNQLAWNQNQQLGSNLGQGLQGLAKGWNNVQTPGWAGGGNGGFATNSWAQANPGVAGSAFYGPVMS
jgi:hypothetical protein